MKLANGKNSAALVNMDSARWLRDVVPPAGRKKLRQFQQRRDWRRSGIHVAKGSWVDSQTEIGRNTRINAPSHVGQCTIGSFVACAGRLIVRPTNHRTDLLNMQSAAQQRVIKSEISVIGQSRGPLVIGDSSWIGDSVIILAGGGVGVGAIIGAGSVVTSKVPDFAVAVGVPARVVRFRFAGFVREWISELAWWEWPDERIRANRQLFELDLTTITESELYSLRVLD